MSKGLSLYLAGLVFLSAALGVQIVLLPWLAIDYLALSSTAVGVVQTAVLLPNLLLLLIGGVYADRGKPLLIFKYILSVYGLVHGLLLLLLVNAGLSLWWLLVYALLLGMVNGFAQPCKEYLLSLVASADSVEEADVQATIAKASIAQYAGQALGILLASQLYTGYVNNLPLLQLVFLACAFGCIVGLKRVLAGAMAPVKQQGFALDWRQCLSGLDYCWRSTLLRTLLAIVCVNGFFHIGVFLVALPLLTKQIYSGDAGLYGLLQCLFVFGSVTTAIVVIYRRQLDAPGRRFLFALLYGGIVLLALSAQPTPYGVMILLFLWGLVVGISATMGRTIVQTQVADAFRGRVISVYQLALFGFAPLGALVAGVFIDIWGVLALLRCAGIVSLVVFALSLLTRELWAVDGGD
ncbi:MAG: MFS transporter [Cellvibrionaceae bacterium]|nr:MFS transporter [Cellvibrionaceae bacterium]